MVVLTIDLLLLALLVVRDGLLTDLQHLRIVLRVQILRLEFLIGAQELAEGVALEDRPGG